MLLCNCIEIFVDTLYLLLFLIDFLIRLRDKVVTSITESAKRYVITNPPFDFGLLPTDQVRYFLLKIVLFQTKCSTVYLEWNVLPNYGFLTADETF